MPNNYSRNTYNRHPEKIERNHLCPLCGSYVMPFWGKLGDEHKGHCPKCGTVTYVSMPETVTHEFTSFIRAELDTERRKALQIVLDVASVSTPQPENLGTCFTILGGEVMELDAHLESQYELNTEEDMLF